MLNVKDPEAHRLAQAIAKETGQSLTKVVIDSLRERHEKLQKSKGKASLEELTYLARQISKTLKRPSVAHADLLYNKL